MSDSSAVQDAITPVIKTFVVPLPVAAAFGLFTAEIGRWWPLATHSVFEGAAATCAIEEHVGGRIYEVDAQGQQAEWGRILRWDPPRRFACSWYPGRESDTAQELEVSFQSEGEGTRVTLVHTGWEQLGAAGPAARMGYDQGWDTVLQGYVELATTR